MLQSWGKVHIPSGSTRQSTLTVHYHPRMEATRAYRAAVRLINRSKDESTSTSVSILLLDNMKMGAHRNLYLAVVHCRPLVRLAYWSCKHSADCNCMNGFVLLPSSSVAHRLYNLTMAPILKSIFSSRFRRILFYNAISVANAFLGPEGEILAAILVVVTG